MGEDTIIISFERTDTGHSMDLEVPVSLTAKELVFALNKSLMLGISMDDQEGFYLRSENPTALLRGETTLEELHLHHGSRVIFDKR